MALDAIRSAGRSPGSHPERASPVLPSRPRSRHSRRSSLDCDRSRQSKRYRPDLSLLEDRTMLAATFTAAGTIQDIGVDITNQYAFLGTTSTTGEFQVVNVTTPAAMALTKTVDVTGTTSTVGGVAYNNSLDVVTGASVSTTQRFLTFTRN